MDRLSIFYLIVVFIDFLLCDAEPDQCDGMGKTMRKLKCGETILQEEKVYNAKKKQFQSKQASLMVQEHYADLPYPPFSMGDMAREMTYYTNSLRVLPILMQYTNSLDILNHHLYQVDSMVVVVML